MIESLGSGGAERLLYTNLKHFDREDIESEVVTVYPGADFWKQQIEDLGVTVSSLNCKGISGLPAAASRLRQHLPKSKPDLIHTHLWAANIIGRTAGRFDGIPVISSIHNPEYEAEAAANASFLLRRKIRFAKFLDRRTSGWCSRMIAVSRMVAESAVRNLNYPAAKVSVLYNPVDVPESSESQDKEATLVKIGIPANARILLNVGRLAPQKGLIHAIQAMPEILRELPNAHLISIGAKGDPAYSVTIQAVIEKLDLADSVHLLGEKRNINDFLKICDVFVFPSEFEGLGIALAEAMAAGCACVASKIRPLDEFVVDAINGLLVDPLNPGELADKVIKLLENSELRASLGKEATKTALNLFEPHEAARKLSDIYRETVNKLE
jgi:glycosyltransferase involved in cell wall biosynthesis